MKGYRLQPAALWLLMILLACLGIVALAWVETAVWNAVTPVDTSAAEVSTFRAESSVLVTDDDDLMDDDSTVDDIDLDRDACRAPLLRDCADAPGRLVSPSSSG